MVALGIGKRVQVCLVTRVGANADEGTGCK